MCCKLPEYMALCRKIWRYDKMAISQKDQELIGLLRVNAREPVASLARKLGLSRTTVQDRLRKLEQAGAIAGYGVRLGAAAKAGFEAFISFGIEPRRHVDVAKAMARHSQIELLCTVSGKYDIIARAKTDNAEAMDRLIDDLVTIPGVKEVETSVILSTKLDRK
jgi:DNA-binding Lrp family transcriptional regulator